MKLTIELHLDNAAFVDLGTKEVRRLMEEMCDRLPEPLTETRGKYLLHDCNEEHAGTFHIE